jgi:hypothetical protein
MAHNLRYLDHRKTHRTNRISPAYPAAPNKANFPRFQPENANHAEKQSQTNPIPSAAVASLRARRWCSLTAGADSDRV